MRPFLLEPVFWRSATHVVLRSLGLSGQAAYRVMVRAEPVWLQDEQTGKREAFGLYATQVVMAHSDADARAAALESVREAVLAAYGNAAEASTTYEVEESHTLGGVFCVASAVRVQFVPGGTGARSLGMKNEIGPGASDSEGSCRPPQRPPHPTTPSSAATSPPRPSPSRRRA